MAMHFFLIEITNKRHFFCYNLTLSHKLITKSFLLLLRAIL